MTIQYDFTSFFSSKKYTYSNSSSSSSSEVILFEHTITGPPHYTTFQIFQDFFFKNDTDVKNKINQKRSSQSESKYVFFLVFYFIFVLLYYYCFFFIFWNFFSHFAFHSKYKCKNDVIYITVKQNITAAVV